MRLIARSVCLAAAVCIAAAAAPAVVGADPSACQPGASPGGDPSVAGGVNVHLTVNNRSVWCSAQVVESNSDIPDGTQYPLHSATASPSDNPVSHAISVSKLLTLAGVDPGTVNHTELARLSGGATSLNTADLTDPANRFINGLAPIFWINGSETDYTRPLRFANDTNGDDQIVASGGAPFDLYVYSGPVLNVTAHATPTKVATRQPVTFTASVANATPADGALTYKWDFQDGTTGKGASATHSYSVAGVWRATVTVQGAANDSGGVSQPVSVTVGSVPKGAGPGPGGGTKHNNHPRSGGPKQGNAHKPGTKPTHHTGGSPTDGSSPQPTTSTPHTGPASAAPSPAANTPAVSSPATTSPTPHPTVKAPRPAAHKLPAPPAQATNVVDGRLISDVIPVSAAQLATRSAVQASPSAATLGGGAVTPVAGIAGGCVVILLLGAGAALELRSQRRPVTPARRP